MGFIHQTAHITQNPKRQTICLHLIYCYILIYLHMLRKLHRSKDEAFATQTIKGHNPVWLGIDYPKIIASGIVAYLSETGHRSSNDSFTVVYRVPSNELKFVRQCHLATVESILI